MCASKRSRALVRRAHDDVRTTVNLAKAGKVQEAIEKVRSDEGRLLMDQLSDTVSQFIATEEQELAERNAHIHQMRYWLTATSIVALASAVMLSFLLFSRVQRAARVLLKVSQPCCRKRTSRTAGE